MSRVVFWAIRSFLHSCLDLPKKGRKAGHNVVCHIEPTAIPGSIPGWPTFFGLAKTKASFQHIFSGPEPPQFLTSNVRLHTAKGVGWVFVEENLLGASLSAVAAVNVFKHTDDVWEMVGHQAAPLAHDLNLDVR